MKISYNWLKQYIDTDLAPEAMGEILTSIGLEVDGLEKIESIRGGLQGVVVGHVLTCEKHPDADKLSVTTVDLGDGGDPVQIVCGAPNVRIRKGQKVLVATVGTTLYPKGETEGFKIRKSKIRGQESLGMICAEDELGLGDNYEGIMVLDADTRPGTPGREYFDLTDHYVFEIGLTPNRVDAASHYGVARDLAAYLKNTGKAAKLTLPSIDEVKFGKKGKSIEVEVQDPEGCPRYMGITISNVKVGPSPEWMQVRLRNIGLKPINNIVDITNYVLHGVGQPLHAFDADRIEGGKIVVRRCEEGTPFTTLDGVERKLSAADLMICSADRPMCIAGVFGGLDSGVTNETKTVFIESAYFNPVSVRKTARYHGLNTDSSFRFERGTDPDITLYALLRAAILIKFYAGGDITSDIVDVYPKRIKPFKVELRYEHMDRLIGKTIDRSQIVGILESLEIKIVREMPDGLSLEVPPYRVDVTREADVIEEILRIYGYNNVEIPESVRSTVTYAENPDRDNVRNILSDFLSANGFHEIMSNSLTKGSYYEANPVYSADQSVKILNPLSSDLGVMRQTLLYNALEAAQLNINRRRTDLKLYEFGNCYFYDEGRKDIGGLAPYQEEYHLSMLVTGPERPESWNVKGQMCDFFTLKSYAEKALRRFGIDLADCRSEFIVNDIFREGLLYDVRGRKLFEMGILTKKLRNRFDIKNEAYYLELNFDTLIRLIKTHQVRVKELTKFPKVRRDLALLIDKNVTFAQLRRIALNTEKKLLRSVFLFDVYEGDKLPEGKKSYAMSFVFQDAERTMTDEMTERIMEKLTAQFEKQAGAKIRS